MQFQDNFPVITLPDAVTQGPIDLRDQGGVFQSGVTQPVMDEGSFGSPGAGDGSSQAGGPGGRGGGFWPDWLKKLFRHGDNQAPPPTGDETTDSLLQRILKDPDTYKGIADRLGGMASGARTERGDENDYNNRFNSDLVNRYRVNQDATLDALLQAGRDKMTGYGVNQVATTSALKNQSDENIDRAKLGLTAPTTRAHQSVLGSMMQNLQPRQITVPAGQRGHEWGSRGGMNASVLDPLTRQHGGALLKDALNAQLTGSDVPAATDFMGGVLAKPDPTNYSAGVLTPPTLERYGGPGRLESVTSAAGTGFDFAKWLADTIAKNRGSSGGSGGGGYGPGNGYPGPT